MHVIDRSAALAVAALLTLSVVAGCLGDEQDRSRDPAGPGNGPPGGAAAPVASFTLQDCTEQFGVFEIPASQAEPYLPEGFEPAGRGAAPLPAGTAELVIVSLTCEDPANDEAVTQFWADIVVDPPEAYQSETALFHYVHVMGLATGQPTLGVYATWGVPRMAEGAVQVDVDTEGPVLRDGETRASNGSHEARLTLTGIGPPQTVPAGTIRVFGVEQREVTGIMDVTFTPFTGSFGQAGLEDDGLVPVTVDGPGVGGNFWGYDAEFRMVEPPSSA